MLLSSDAIALPIVKSMCIMCIYINGNAVSLGSHSYRMIQCETLNKKLLKSIGWLVEHFQPKKRNKEMDSDKKRKNTRDRENKRDTV